MRRHLTAIAVAWTCVGIALWIFWEPMAGLVWLIAYGPLVIDNLRDKKP